MVETANRPQNINAGEILRPTALLQERSVHQSRFVDSGEPDRVTRGSHPLSRGDDLIIHDLVLIDVYVMHDRASAAFPEPDADLPLRRAEPDRGGHLAAANIIKNFQDVCE